MIKGPEDGRVELETCRQISNLLGILMVTIDTRLIKQPECTVLAIASCKAYLGP